MTKPESPTVRFPAGEPALLTPGVKLGDVIAGDYRIERELGRGGMGVVFAAFQQRLERLVAIKLIRSESAQDPRAVERLLREAKAVGRIQSEHVARVLDVGLLESGAPFIVMEYLDGHDLEALLRSGPLAITLAVDYLLQACEAVGEAHRNGIVHRDLKPANVFIAQQTAGVFSVKVLDFGISKVIGNAAAESLTDQSRPIGSLHHMAPEQLRGKPVDARTDIWALGVVLYEMLTGEKPFTGNTWPDICAQVLNEAGPVLDTAQLELPEELKAILRRCLSRNAAERFPNVAELAVALTPFGTNRARASLERIVRLATSTGSLAAVAAPSPAPPAAGSPTPLPPTSRDDTPVVPPSYSELFTKQPSTKDAVVTSVVPRPTRPFLVGAGVGVGVASVVAALLLLRSERSDQSERPQAVQHLEALPMAQPSPPPPAPALPAASAIAAPPTAPRITLLPSQQPALPRVELGSEPPETKQASRPQLVGTAAVRPSSSSGSELAPHAAERERTPAAALLADTAAPDGGMSAREPAARPGRAPSTAGDAFDLSDVGFKPNQRIQR